MMNEPLPESTPDLGAGDEETYRLAHELIALGEGKVAVDMLRKKVNIARKSPPSGTLMRLRLLSQYAGILESIDALAEAEFIRAEALEIVGSGFVTAEDALDAYLKHGLLMVKMHHYDGAVARLKEAVRRAESLESLGNLQQQIIIAQAWKGQAEAFEALGELEQASQALDALANVKRHIRFLVFTMPA
jgi:tetratricopeptide (TPR) repeat protein